MEKVQTTTAVGSEASDFPVDEQRQIDWSEEEERLTRRK